MKTPLTLYTCHICTCTCYTTRTSKEIWLGHELCLYLRLQLGGLACLVDSIGDPGSQIGRGGDGEGGRKGGRKGGSREETGGRVIGLCVKTNSTTMYIQLTSGNRFFSGKENWLKSRP